MSKTLLIMQLLAVGYLATLVANFVGAPVGGKELRDISQCGISNVG